MRPDEDVAGEKPLRRRHVARDGLRGAVQPLDRNAEVRPFPHDDGHRLGHRRIRRRDRKPADGLRVVLLDRHRDRVRSGRFCGDEIARHVVDVQHDRPVAVPHCVVRQSQRHDLGLAVAVGPFHGHVLPVIRFRRGVGRLCVQPHGRAQRARAAALAQNLNRQRTGRILVDGQRSLLEDWRRGPASEVRRQRVARRGRLRALEQEGLRHVDDLDRHEPIRAVGGERGRKRHAGEEVALRGCHLVGRLAHAPERELNVVLLHRRFASRRRLHGERALRPKRHRRQPVPVGAVDGRQGRHSRRIRRNLVGRRPPVGIVLLRRLVAERDHLVHPLEVGVERRRVAGAHVVELEEPTGDGAVGTQHDEAWDAGLPALRLGVGDGDVLGAAKPPVRRVVVHDREISRGDFRRVRPAVPVPRNLMARKIARSALHALLLRIGGVHVAVADRRRLIGEKRGLAGRAVGRHRRHVDRRAGDVVGLEPRPERIGADEIVVGLHAVGAPERPADDHERRLPLRRRARLDEVEVHRPFPCGKRVQVALADPARILGAVLRLVDEVDPRKLRTRPVLARQPKRDALANGERRAGVDANDGLELSRRPRHLVRDARPVRKVGDQQRRRRRRPRPADRHVYERRPRHGLQPVAGRRACDKLRGRNIGREIGIERTDEFRGRLLVIPVKRVLHHRSVCLLPVDADLRKSRYALDRANPLVGAPIVSRTDIQPVGNAGIFLVIPLRFVHEHHDRRMLGQPGGEGGRILHVVPEPVAVATAQVPPEHDERSTIRLGVRKRVGEVRVPLSRNHVSGRRASHPA